MKKTITQRQRKFLLVLPVLVIPFITMAFWALDGGKEKTVSAAVPGLITELPGAALKEENGMDKLGYYDRATADSLQLLEQMKNDPYFTKSTLPDPLLDTAAELSVISGTNESYTDPNEAKVYAKLGQLNAALKAGSTRPHPAVAEAASEMEMPEQFAPSGAAAADTEMQQYNSLLEKILDIQHPERVTERKETAPAISFTVSTDPSTTTYSLIDSARIPSGDFFGLHDKREAVTANAIAAVVHETQTLVSGSIVKMRLLSDITVNGHTIAKDRFVFGVASLNKERLEITIPSVRDGGFFFPVKMEVFDTDGLAGIYIPGAIGREVAKQAGDNALQSLSLGSVDTSPGAQAAAAGIETAKNFLSRKVKLVKVQVKAGYKIFLQNKNQ